MTEHKSALIDCSRPEMSETVRPLRRGVKLTTRITQDYGLHVPLVSAGMAFVATQPLVEAVCAAGGMGILGIAAMPPDRRNMAACSASPAMTTAPSRPRSRISRTTPSPRR